MESSLVQILVVVANIQVRILKSDEEKGSMRTANGHGLVVPNMAINFVKRRKNFVFGRRKIMHNHRKGSRLIFLYLV